MKKLYLQQNLKNGSEGRFTETKQKQEHRRSFLPKEVSEKLQLQPKERSRSFSCNQRSGAEASVATKGVEQKLQLQQPQKEQS
jgi:hypothetical protein